MNHKVANQKGNKVMAKSKTNKKQIAAMKVNKPTAKEQADLDKAIDDAIAILEDETIAAGSAFENSLTNYATWCDTNGFAHLVTINLKGDSSFDSWYSKYESILGSEPAAKVIWKNVRKLGAKLKRSHARLVKKGKQSDGTTTFNYEFSTWVNKIRKKMIYYYGQQKSPDAKNRAKDHAETVKFIADVNSNKKTKSTPRVSTLVNRDLKGINARLKDLNAAVAKLKETTKKQTAFKSKTEKLESKIEQVGKAIVALETIKVQG